jgi:hypothetical protein
MFVIKNSIRWSTPIFINLHGFRLQISSSWYFREVNFRFFKFFVKRVRKNYQKISIKIGKHDFHRIILDKPKNIDDGIMKFLPQTYIHSMIIKKNFRKFLPTFGLFIAICKFETFNS